MSRGWRAALGRVRGTAQPLDKGPPALRVTRLLEKQDGGKAAWISGPGQTCIPPPYLHPLTEKQPVGLEGLE